MKKNAFLTFCFSLVPGAGQMYQSYMKRGLSILIIFCIILCVAILLQTAIFIVFSLIVWVYSFFDTFNIRNSIDTENKVIDGYIWGNSSLGESFNNILSKRSFLIGIALLCIGIYLLLNNVVSGIAYRYNIEWLHIAIGFIRYYLPSVIIAALSIGIGIKLMFNKKG